MDVMHALVYAEISTEETEEIKNAKCEERRCQNQT